jgi:hypothetical protein
MSTIARLVIDDLENFHLLTTDMKEAIIKAAINKVNIQAARTRNRAIQNIQKDFTVRNTFTARQVQYTQMPQGRYSLSAIQSAVGITIKAGYMARQETGGLHKPAAGKGSLAIPTDAARGGAKSAPVSKKNYLSKIKSKIVQARGYLLGGENRSRIAAMAAEAFQKGGFVSLNKKLFRVENFVSKGNSAKFRLRQVYGFDKKATVTTAQPWLKPAAEEIGRQGEKIFIRELQKLGL